MISTSPRRLVIFLIANAMQALTFGTTISAEEPAVVARDAWVRLPPPSKDEAAMYMVIENHGGDRRAIVGASCEGVQKIEMHEMRMSGRLMSMNQIDRIVVSPKGKTTLSSGGGLHMMLFGFKTRPMVGDVLSVTLKLDDGTTVPVTAAVRK
jgi:copper(I)-binding protein